MSRNGIKLLYGYDGLMIDHLLHLLLSFCFGLNVSKWLSFRTQIIQVKQFVKVRYLSFSTVNFSGSLIH